MSNVLALWRGEISLPKTGWGYGLLITVAMSIPLVFITISGYAAAVPNLMLALSVAILLHTPFMAVAIWRSANRYEGRGLWRWLAKGSILFIILYVVIGLLT